VFTKVTDSADSARHIHYSTFDVSPPSPAPSLGSHNATNKSVILVSIFVNEVVNYKSRKREVQIRLVNESRYNERPKGRVQEPTCLTYTGLHDKTN
jgi:hypothetical protein